MGLRVNLINNSIDRVLVPYEAEEIETIKDSIQDSINNSDLLALRLTRFLLIKEHNYHGAQGARLIP